MATEFCPHCHQPFYSVVEGVRLPIFKARLFRFIQSHPGQSGIDLSQRYEVEPVTIRQHILQINDALMDTPFRIIGGRWLGYRIIKQEIKNGKLGTEVIPPLPQGPCR